MKFENIRLLTLDLDDTLWPCWPTIEAAEASLWQWISTHTPRVTESHDWKSLHQHRRELADQRPDIAHDLTRLREQSLHDIFTAHDYPPELAFAASEHFVAERQKVNPFDDVADALQALRKDYILVSVTNGNANIARTPLAGLFDLSLTAADVGAQRPDPAMLHRALTHFDVSVEQTLHIGDDPHRDVVAAQLIGMSAVWMNRFDRQWPQELNAADAQVKDLHELRTLLDT